MNNRTVVPKNIYSKLFREYRRGQMGYAAIAIIGQSCLGSAAAMALLMGSTGMTLKMVLLFLITIFCMAYNGAVLAQLKPISSFNLLILSLGVSTLVILGHLI